MRSPTKPEVRNVSQHHRKEIDPQATSTENFVKFGHEVFEICEGDRQIHKHAHHNAMHPQIHVHDFGAI